MKTMIAARSLALVLLLSVGASAQPTVSDAPSGSTASGAPLAPGASTPAGSSVSKAQVTTTTTTTSTPGLYFPMGSEAAKNNAATLPSSSRPVSDIGTSRDGFDLNQSGGATVVRGSKGSFAITGESRRAVVVPDVHTVRPGDTMWDLCGHYLGNPWDWPRIWSYNPDVQNPNWIYPGDQLRLRSPDESGRAPVAQNDTLQSQLGMFGSGPSNRADQPTSSWGGSGKVGKDTIFLRNEAYIDDPDKDVWGQVVGANEEQMLLGQGNHVYLDLKPSVEVKVGQQLTLFERSRKPERVEGARQPPGEIVIIKGTLRVTDFDPKKHVARAEIVESSDVIERGAKVGAIGRRYVVLAPKPSRVTVWARLLNGIYPHVYLGQQQLVFVDRGSEDGLVAGNRLLVIRRGDSWRRSLGTTARSSRVRLRTDHPEPTRVEPVELRREDGDFPDEVVGEVRIVQAHPWSSLAVVTSSHRELVPGDRAVAREGY
jgi:hypothetical protein